MKQTRILLLITALALLVSACNLGSGAEVTATFAQTSTRASTTTGTTTITATVRIPTQLPLPTTRGTIVNQLPTAVFPATSRPIPTSIPPVQPTAVSPTRIAILSPGPGSIVSGNIQVTGAALHPRFLQYQLEYGPDPNPGGLWYPADSVRFTPVLDNVLGSWNTTSLPDGTYTLRLRVFLRDGTTLSTVSNNIRVRNTAPTPVPSATPSTPRPVAAFSADRYSGESPLTVRFFNQSSGSISSVSWNFGDNTTSSEPNPTHTYNGAGLYTVTLSVTGIGGTSNVSSQINVRTVTAPIAGFSQSAASGRAPLTVQFSDQSTGNITSWFWNFSDGTTSTERNPSHTFTGVGTYNVFLTTTGPGGTSITRRQIVVENPVVPPPNALFTFTPPTGVSPLTVQFTNQSTGNITGYTWNFGDGTLSNDTNPLHTFSFPGTYTVTLFATGPGGHNTTQANVIVVAPTATPTATTTPVPPTATFTATLTPVPPTATFTMTPIPPTATFTGVPPTATFTESATNTPLPLPTLTNTPTETPIPPSVTLTETPIPPTATFTETPTDTPIPPTVTFTDTPLPLPTETPTDTPVPPTLTETPTDTLVPPTLTETPTDTLVPPTLTETPTDTLVPPTLTETPIPPTATFTETPVPPTDTPVPTNTPTPVPPSALFTASVVQGAPLTVQFTNQSSGEITGITWDFGDGQTSSEPSPIHTYAQGGDYTVTLTVSGPGGSNSYQGIVSVIQPPAAAFSAGVTADPMAIQFANQSTGSVATLLWNFGDGTTSEEPNPIHTYPAAGDYNVTLTVTASDGVTSDSETQLITVVAPTPTTEPVDAIFTTSPVEGNSLAVQFVNQSTGPVGSLTWDFGDGQTSADPNPQHTYGAAGDYPVTLTVVSSGDGSTDSASSVVTVVAPTPTPEPIVAAFSAAPVEGSPLAIQFTSAASGPVATYLWDFGDGQTSGEIHPVHTYGAGGDYNVTLTVTAADGVTTNSVTNLVSVVQPTPTATTEPIDAAFVAEPVAETPLTVQFTNQSTGPVASTTWDFGDGQTSTEPNPVHTYPAAGDYNVTLTTTAADGVTTDTASQPVSVAAAPEPEPEPLITFNAFIGEVNDAIWNPSGTRAAAANEDGTISLWDTATEQVANTLTGHQTEVVALAWSPNGAYLASASSDGLLLIWDTSTLQPVATTQAAAAINALAWNLTSSNVVAGGADGSITLYDAAGNPTPLLTANDAVNALAWGVSDTRLLVGVDDGSIILLDTATYTPVYTLEADNSVTSVAWNPSNLQFATGVADGTVVIWDVASGQPALPPLSEHANAVTAVAWSPNGTQILSGSADGEIILWDVISGTSVETFNSHTDAITSVEWNSDGTRFLSASDDGTVLVWQP